MPSISAGSNSPSVPHDPNRSRHCHSHISLKVKGHNWATKVTHKHVNISSLLFFFFLLFLFILFFVDRNRCTYLVCATFTVPLEVSKVLIFVPPRLVAAFVRAEKTETRRASDTHEWTRGTDFRARARERDATSSRACDAKVALLNLKRPKLSVEVSSCDKLTTEVVETKANGL